jgi:putative glutamine amidotransferase
MYIYIDNKTKDVIEINQFHDKDTNVLKTNKVYIGKIDKHNTFCPNEFYDNKSNKAEINLKLSEALEDLLSPNNKTILEDKPVIGLAALVNQEPKDTAFKNFSRHFCNDAFILKIINSGAVPMMIPYIREENDKLIPQFVNSIDGLMLPGGADIDPTVYGEEKVKECGKTDITLDLFHIKLIKECIKQRKPILGICRGFQLINVALGGTLYQDISYFKKDINHMDLKNYEGCTHDIEISDNTILKSIVNTNTLGVNSLHHQIVKDIAPTLKLSAKSPEGIIEGLESKDSDTFIVGVQWHPETMVDNKEIMDKIFKAFTTRCSL